MENFTFLWVHSKEISNQARKAWISGRDAVRTGFRKNIGKRDEQSLRVAVRVNGAANVRSSFFAVRRLMCWKHRLLF